MGRVQEAWAQGKWTASSDGTLDPGWMLPAILLCRVYSAYLNTTPDAHMHRMQRPLPLHQLYTSDAPSAGLLALLKFALWQVLWVEPSTGDFPTLHQHKAQQLLFVSWLLDAACKLDDMSCCWL